MPPKSLQQFEYLKSLKPGTLLSYSRKDWSNWSLAKAGQEEYDKAAIGWVLNDKNYQAYMPLPCCDQTMMFLEAAISPGRFAVKVLTSETTLWIMAWEEYLPRFMREFKPITVGT